MAIAETQLHTWSHQGAVAQSRDTYATIRRALESDRTAYHGNDFKSFLQGSYGNDTNVYAESDVRCSDLPAINLPLQHRPPNSDGTRCL